METTQPVRLMEIPGPSGGPLLGMAPAMRRDTLGTLMAGFERYGDVVAYRLGPRRGPLQKFMVAAYHPAGVQQVLTRTEHDFGRKAQVFKVMREVLGLGLLTTEGDLWRRQRRTLQPLFIPRRVAGYRDLMAAEAETVAERIVAERIATEPMGSGAVVDLHSLMLRYTLRVVGRALFGEELDDVIEDLQRLVPAVTDLTHARILQVVRLPLAWPTPRNRRLGGLRAEQYAIVDGVIGRRRGLDETRGDLLTRLQAARDPETGRALSMQEIRDQVLIFLRAGHETASSALTFTLHLLGRHPEVQDRVADDCSAAAGPFAEVRPRLTLARAALLEGMRLFPPAYVIARVTNSDTDIGGHHVPRGTTVLVSPWVTHRHPAFWPEPERFDLDRFTTETDRTRYAYLPFGGGPHSCIGEHFALLEATVLVQALLSRYRIEALDPALQTVALTTLRPAAPVWVRLTSR
jgi:cytochrome P450